MNERLFYSPRTMLTFQQGATVDVDGEEFCITFSKDGLRVRCLAHYNGTVDIELTDLVEDAITLLKEKGKQVTSGNGFRSNP